MKYNFLQWWLSVSIKPKVYQVWKYIITFVVFIGWVACIAVFSDLYWKYSLFVMLPIAVVDLIWDGINYLRYKGTIKSDKSSDEQNTEDKQ
ncbi:MAG: hypothetical protein ACI4MI_02000 [Christensenellales bacterium]